MRIAPDQFGIVEVVTGIHADARRQTAAHRDLARVIEQRNLDTVDLRGVCFENAKADIRRSIEITRSPVPHEGGIEHFAEPVDNNGLPYLREDVPVDMRVVVRPRGARGESTARHQDHAPSLAFHKADLLLVRGNYFIKRA